MQPEQPKTSVRTKVSLNPFGHFIQGNKDLFSTNAVPAILASMLTVVLSFAMSLLSLLLVSSAFIGSAMHPFGSGGLANLLVKVVIFIVIAILINSYFYEIVTRTILTGTRREHVSFGSLFSFVAKRFITTLLAFLMIVGVVVAAFAAIALGSAIHPILGVLIGIAGLIFIIVFGLRMSYVPFVAVDDEKPESARWILKRSAQLWKHSGGALIMYFFIILIFAILLAVISGSGSTGSTGGLQGQGVLDSAGPFSSSAIAYGSLIVGALIQGVISLLLVAAIGNIYNEARQIVDGDNPRAVPNITAPVASVPSPPTTPQPSTGS